LCALPKLFWTLARVQVASTSHTVLRRSLPNDATRDKREFRGCRQFSYCLQSSPRGTVAQPDAQGAYLFNTNVGSTWTSGIEAVEVPIVTQERVSLNAFASSALFQARYRDGTVVSGGKNVSIVGNPVEAVPDLINREGLTARTGRWSATALVSYTSSSFRAIRSQDRITWAFSAD